MRELCTCVTSHANPYLAFCHQTHCGRENLLKSHGLCFSVLLPQIVNCVCEGSKTKSWVTLVPDEVTAFLLTALCVLCPWMDLSPKYFLSTFDLSGEPPSRPGW